MTQVPALFWYSGLLIRANAYHQKYCDDHYNHYYNDYHDDHGEDDYNDYHGDDDAYPRQCLSS